MVKLAGLKTPTFKRCCVSPCDQNRKMDLGFVYEAMRESWCAVQYDVQNWHELLITSDWERIALDCSIIEMLFICLHLTQSVTIPFSTIPLFPFLQPLSTVHYKLRRRVWSRFYWYLPKLGVFNGGIQNFASFSWLPVGHHSFIHF